MKLSDIAVNPALIEQGDWVEDLPDMPGIRIKARGLGNSDYRKLEAKLIRQVPRALRIEGLAPKDQDRIMGRLLLETVVLDVQGLEDDSGPITYTRALGEKLLLDPEFARFRAAAATAAEIVAGRQKAATDADAKLTAALLWQLEWGDSFDRIVAAAEGAGVTLDQLPCVTSRIDPEPHLLFEWEAFGELRTDRPVGLESGAIPWGAINAFALRHDIMGDEFARFLRLIRAMDAAERAELRRSADAQP
ncbi:phage tail assembly chaperone (plasmid) [Bradyrhizobium oligotrophicum S58]